MKSKRVKGNLLIISGPSGSGKSSLVKEMMKRVEDTYFSISTTTRGIREGEVDGRDYFYTTKEEFERDIENGYFLEWAKVHDNYYGTSIRQIDENLQKGKLVILDIDVQGFEIAKDRLGDLVTSIFITTPNRQTLQERLAKRGTDSKESIEIRVKNALEEMQKIDKYDYFIINDDFDKALETLISIAIASKNRVASFDLKKFIESWKS